MRTTGTPGISWERARNVCIVKTLAKLGHFPSKTTEKEAWFLSPLRSETHASFSVSLRKNLWYDFGMGKGGNVIDLVMLVKSFSNREALEFLETGTIATFSPPVKKPVVKQGIKVLKVETLKHRALISYLDFRKIPVEVARVYCAQVWYQYKDRQFYAIGLRNNKGGWELRNKYFKNSSSPKTYSFIQNGSRQLVITEGMFDFLSLATMEEVLVNSSDAIVLNSLAFVDRIKGLLPKYERVLLYLDNDTAGKKAAASLLQLYNHITDCSDSYSGYIDLNEKLKDEKDRRE
ncbi:toprim domain-containing protein [Zunongwangia sp. HRR-M8]|uniref:toprim domain-containing protein n=1 Tax=Zunongwangia sp. HRR-M8 TaxID=3015170 RepID=UPI0022DD4F78|nr:toprim domain-containing protein [Zunongwangia sp. HRR-M8]WBL22334.1 toprim domain-containing protein [Zunongwangia sp. HRR-M8]